uniref:Uncharacterized protein n=1 Tax=Alexandrium monilatum TaxID=311494 RepID=A0A7S4RNX4_9DINO
MAGRLGLSLVSAALLLGVARGSPYMKCGEGVHLCGVLTLQSGLGSGAYHHRQVGVHGLWPETGDNGNSECVRPRNSSADPTKVYPCYNQASRSTAQLLSFERHEWEKHGACAGVADEHDYFTQVCSLTQAPAKTMEDARLAGRDLQGMADALSKAGYPIWYVDSETEQVLLAACAGSDHRWVISEAADFPSKCAGGRPSPGPSPSPGPAGTCVHGQRGPRCHSDSDCSGLKGCVRCSHHGHCTDVPIFESEMLV